MSANKVFQDLANSSSHTQNLQLIDSSSMKLCTFFPNASRQTSLVCDQQLIMNIDF